MRLTLSVLFIVVVSSLTSQTTLQLNSIADAQIDKYYNTQNYSSSNTMLVYPWGSNTKRAVIKFDLSGIPSNATIVSANLHLSIGGTFGYSTQINVHEIETNWTETSVTWNIINPSYSSVVEDHFSPVFPGSAEGVWDLTNSVQSMVNGQPNNGWMLKANNESPTHHYWEFYTKEYSGQEFRPVLEVVYEVNDFTLSVSQNPICKGESTYIQATGANQYIWTPIESLNTSSGNSVVASPSLTTIYSVKGIFANNDTLVKTVRVDVNPKPVLQLTFDSISLALGDSVSIDVVELSGESNITWNWMPTSYISSSSSQNVIVFPTEDRDYQVTASTPSGCSETKTVHIDIEEGLIDDYNIDYAQLEKELSSDYYLTANNILPFVYEENYQLESSSTLSFKVFNYRREVVLDGNSYPIQVSAGLNKVIIDNLSTYIPTAGYYVLEITNGKKEKSYLRFKI
jgi:hypothetical protein